jgi:transcriptional regulator GlxA family with amidase domain
MRVAIPLFDRLTALDAVGPYEVLSRLPGTETLLVASEPGPKRADAGLALLAERPLSEACKPDIIVVPGGVGVREAMRDSSLLDWIRSSHATSTWTASVCTGALVLGAAGILRGINATTHWNHLHRLSEFGANPVASRIVEHGKVITAAGVSAGIDMALRLAQIIAGDTVAQAIQLSIEYDPEPPFDAGSPAKATEQVVELVRRTAAKAQSR